MITKYVIIPNPETVMVDGNSIYFANDEKDLQNAIKSCASRNLGKCINVYELRYINKLVTEPSFAKYEYTKDGELIPC